MNYLNLNTMPRPFVFNKRNERIDWRRIAGVDVERVARELDFQVLQDNIEHIALCNIDVEIDSRAMDPNYIKLYKMAQLIIEYLLLCQDQITTQLADYEQLKSKYTVDQDETRRQLEKLRNDFNETKKESKKRKKLIETQQKMLMAQQTTHHSCPVCGHAFLSFDYLQAHMHRRHPEFDSNRKREHDVDLEKENQRLKDDLHNKETELQLIKVQKGVDEEKLRDRDETIRHLKEEIQSLTNKLAIADEKFFNLRSSTQTRSPSPHRREPGLKDLLKENKSLRAENEQLKHSIQQLETDLKKEQKLKRRFEREHGNLQTEINNLNQTIQSLRNASGDSGRLTEELTSYRNRYNEERTRRKKVQEELDEANRQLAEYRNQPPPVADRRSPAPPPRSNVSPSPPPHQPPAPVQPKPIQKTDIYLPEYCPSLVRQINQDPKYLALFRKNTRNQFIDELEQYEDLNIKENDTRLPVNQFDGKMAIVKITRDNIQEDLPNFERIRSDLSRTLDRLANERLQGLNTTGASVRSSIDKAVHFEDQKRRTTVKPVPPKSNRLDSDIDEKTNTNSEESDDNYLQPVQPSPRKITPSAGVSALKPTIVINKNPTVSTLVRPKTATRQQESESESESVKAPVNVAGKTRDLDRKLTEIGAKGQKPGVSAIAQGFQPTRQTVVPQKKNDDDDESDSTFTSIHEVSNVRRTSTGQPPHTATKDILNTNPHLSSGDISQSQYTYDSAYKSPFGKGFDNRRPTTADSAKTSNVDSEDNYDDDSN